MRQKVELRESKENLPHKRSDLISAGYSLVLAFTDWDRTKIDLNAKKIFYPWPLPAVSTVMGKAFWELLP